MLLHLPKIRVNFAINLANIIRSCQINQWYNIPANPWQIHPISSIQCSYLLPIQRTPLTILNISGYFHECRHCKWYKPALRHHPQRIRICGKQVWGDNAECPHCWTVEEAKSLLEGGVLYLEIGVRTAGYWDRWYG